MPCHRILCHSSIALARISNEHGDTAPWLQRRRPGRALRVDGAAPLCRGVVRGAAAKYSSAPANENICPAGCASPMLFLMSDPLPRRPPRIELFQNIRPFYFVTFNARNRGRVLDNGPVHETFTVFCARAHGEHDVAVGRYVLMPDHVHLFVALPDAGIRLTRWMQSLKNALGKTLNACGQTRPHWQEGFFDHVLRSGESYAEKWEYVRQNPVRAGLCKSFDQWPWQGEVVRIEY